MRLGEVRSRVAFGGLLPLVLAGCYESHRVGPDSDGGERVLVDASAPDPGIGDASVPDAGTDAGWDAGCPAGSALPALEDGPSAPYCSPPSDEIRRIGVGASSAAIVTAIDRAVAPFHHTIYRNGPEGWILDAEYDRSSYFGDLIVLDDFVTLEIGGFDCGVFSAGSGGTQGCQAGPYNVDIGHVGPATGGMWVSDGARVYGWNGSFWETRAGTSGSADLGGRTVTALHEYAGGLAVGTTRGVARITTSGPPGATELGDSHMPIEDLCVDSADRLWAVSEEGSVRHYDWAGWVDEGSITEDSVGIACLTEEVLVVGRTRLWRRGTEGWERVTGSCGEAVPPLDVVQEVALGTSAVLLLIHSEAHSSVSCGGYRLLAYGAEEFAWR